jgi:Arc/MetJ-type ribon-helix-helix transcriptional regulator
LISNSKLADWHIKVPKALDQRVEEQVQKSLAVSKSDFVRDAVREKLASLEDRL